MARLATIRRLNSNDDLGAITAVLHAAYACRAAANLRYWATHQTAEDTAKRFEEGQGLIAEVDDQIVGTITVRPPKPDSEVALFRDPVTWTFGQFGVLPEFKGQGIGRQLHDAALALASSNGAKTIALDTAAPAADLIEMYLRWGYRTVGNCDWRPQTNYISVLMSRPIDSHAL